MSAIALECDNCGKYSVPAINDIDDALLNDPCKECGTKASDSMKFDWIIRYLQVLSREE